MAKSHPRSVSSSEIGSIMPYTVAGAFIIVLVALGLMTGLGSVILERRNASTAADAAALAAVEKWAESLESVYTDASKAKSSDEFWDGIGLSAGPFAGSAARHEAERYAALNDATITSYNVNAAEGKITVTVKSNKTVAGTSETMTASATAELVFDKGLCLSKGRVGLRIDGQCKLKAPAAKKPTPPPAKPGDPQPSPTPSPTYRPPKGMDAAVNIDTRLNR